MPASSWPVQPAQTAVPVGDYCGRREGFAMFYQQMREMRNDIAIQIRIKIR